MKPAIKPAKQKIPARPHRRLRARAEGLLRKAPRDISKMAVPDVQNLVHELQVHQVELELQNEELRRVQLELEVSRDRFAELYDFAPASCLTLDEDGVISEANLTAAQMLDLPRQGLISQKLSHFMDRQSQDAFYLHRQRVFSTRLKQSCELQLRRPDGSLFFVALESIRSRDGESKPPRCLSTVTDLTEQKKAVDELVRNVSTLPEENPNPALRIAADGALVYGNPASAFLRAELGCKIGERVPAEWLAKVRAGLVSGKVEEWEVELRGMTFLCTLAPLVSRGYANVYARDITKRKQAAQNLKQNISLLQATLESTADGLLVVDAAGRITNFNRRFAHMWNLPEALMAGRDDEATLNFVLDQLKEPEEFLAKVRELYRQPTVDSFDVLAFKDGRVIERYSRPQMFDERPMGRVWSFRDVTARERAGWELREAHALLETRVGQRTAELEASNRALRESEQRFSQVLENIEELFWMRDVAGKHLLVISAAYEKIWGRTRQSLIASPGQWLQAVHPEDRARVRAAFTEQARGGYDVQYRIRRPNGALRWIHDRAFPIRDEKGNIYRIAGVAEDITARKLAEEILRRSEQELADFFEQSPIGLLWVGADGQILRLNGSQQELLGGASQEALGRTLAEFFANPADAAGLLAALAGGRTVRDHRGRIRQKDGSLKHVLIDANGLWEKNRLVHSRWFVRDITRRVELEREILSISEREQLRMSQDLHDDLCQQLTGIQFLSDTLAMELQAVSETGGAQAKEIARMVRSAITQTRELARGLSPVSLEPEGLTDALSELAARIRRIFRRECDFICVASVVEQDHAVSAHLYRIAQEAVSNAIKHGKARRIEIALRASGDNLVLEISDDGSGIPPKPKNTKGLGLRIMQYRAGVIGGSLVVQPKPSGGTAVVCTIATGPPPTPAKRKK